MSVPHSSFRNETGSLGALPHRQEHEPSPDLRAVCVSVWASSPTCRAACSPCLGATCQALCVSLSLLPGTHSQSVGGREGRNKGFLEPGFLVNVLWILFYKLPNSLPSFLMLAFVIFAFSCFVLFCSLSFSTLQRIQILKLVVFFLTQLSLFEVYHSSPLPFLNFLYRFF